MPRIHWVARSRLFVFGCTKIIILFSQEKQNASRRQTIDWADMACSWQFQEHPLYHSTPQTCLSNASMHCGTLSISRPPISKALYDVCERERANFSFLSLSPSESLFPLSSPVSFPLSLSICFFFLVSSFSLFLLNDLKHNYLIVLKSGVGWRTHIWWCWWWTYIYIVEEDTTICVCSYYYMSYMCPQVRHDEWVSAGREEQELKKLQAYQIYIYI